ncbi:[FeFe] hydrogenase H-cluster radical SAM maturase HydE [Lutispora thermophila]|uniref:Biotin synthase n=1 Tax=Lutispora thermophila DSM 19022 TaxID=1122184 RepID=A0A1M6BDN5_9FIRM|nr:[FeFe] hydrogenase H-cluster radical SAM maturase HydE [Lutispora thermophila]SHI46852.1 biotin synthase [Lutispora thermophila DSM 19022]
MNIDLTDVKKVSQWMESANKKDISNIISFFYEDATENECSALHRLACEARDMHYNGRVYFRGLIEFTNYCKNDCYYCGIQRSNQNITRYRLSEEEILKSCERGYRLGFRTFVLQGGEDMYFTDSRLCSIISKIKEKYPDCAVTLSAGERSRESYKNLYDAGADRYLLRHETANEEHYRKLHPAELSLENRKRCLYDLKEIGFQVGAGFMVDSPFQTYETLAEDFIFLRELKPHMIGIGPFIPHKDTRFAGYYNPSSQHTLILLSLIRIMLPKTLLPSTTALGTVDKNGQRKGFAAGANVIMPNLSPMEHRGDYTLYDNKLYTGLESSEQLAALVRNIESMGLTPDFSRGDYVDMQNAARRLNQQ